MGSNWYARLEDCTVGPLSTLDLHRLVSTGEVTRSTRIRDGKDAEWVPAEWVSDLFDNTSAEGGAIPDGNVRWLPRIVAGLVVVAGILVVGIVVVLVVSRLLRQDLATSANQQMPSSGDPADKRGSATPEVSPPPDSRPLISRLFGPSLSDSWKELAKKFLDRASKINEGKFDLSYRELRSQLADAKGAFDLVVSTWPEGLPRESERDFRAAIDAWDLALDLWHMRIFRSDAPVEPDVNGFRRFTAFAENRLVIKTHPQDFIVPGYRGKRYLPINENIDILLKVSGENYERGKRLWIDSGVLK